MTWYKSLLPAFVRTERVERVDAVTAHSGNGDIEKRSITGSGFELLRQFFTVTNKSGVRANSNNVLGLPAAYSCIRQISETCAMLPIHLIEKRSSGERRYVDQHPAISLLNFRPNNITKAFDLRRDLIAYALIYASGYLYIERNKFTADPVNLWLYDPRDVQELWSQDGRTRYYKLKCVEGTVAEEDVVRITNVFGKSVVSLLNEAFGTSVATQSFAAQYFANNGNVVRYATTPGQTRNSTQKINLEEDLGKKFGPDSNGIPLMEHGIEVKELTGVTMSNAQALETRKWQAEDVCRIFNVPPSKIGLDTGARYNSVEMTEAQFLRQTILPWLTAIEQELRAKLLREREKSTYSFKHVTAALVKADIKTRMESYKAMQQMGWTINEIRELEDYDPIEGGDNAFIQVNQIPLKSAEEYAKNLIEKGAQPAVDNNIKQ